MVIVSVLSMVFGLSGCGGNEKYTVDEIVSFHTSDYGTERFLCILLHCKKEDENWFFSASCYVGSQKEHYTSFGSFRIPAEDAEGFLEVIREDGEIKRLRKYREPKHLFHISDAPMRSSGITFSDGSRIDKKTACGDQTLACLYALADKCYGAAEKVEISGVSVYSSSMDQFGSYSFAIEKEGDDWFFFSFDAVVDSGGVRTEVENQRIGEEDAKEILRIVKEQRLVASVSEYKEPPDDGIYALDETIYRTSFFTDGRSVYAPIDAGSELTDAFYHLAAEETVKTKRTLLL